MQSTRVTIAQTNSNPKDNNNNEAWGGNKARIEAIINILIEQRDNINSLEQIVQDLITRKSNIENIIEPKNDNPSNNQQGNVGDIAIPRKKDNIMELSRDLMKITPPMFDEKK